MQDYKNQLLDRNEVSLRACLVKVGGGDHLYLLVEDGNRRWQADLPGHRNLEYLCHYWEGSLLGSFLFSEHSENYYDSQIGMLYLETNWEPL